MKVCPYCREEVHDEAIKCRFCGSSLLPAQTSTEGTPSNSASFGPDKTVYVLDRDLIRFAKFAGAVLGVLITVGVIFFGVDIKRAVSDADESAKSAQKALTEVQGNLRDAKSADDSALQTAKEVAAEEKSVESARKEVQGLLSQVQQDASFIGTARAKISVVIASVESVAPASAKPGGLSSFTVPQLANLYHFPRGLDGKGQTVGLVELGGGYQQSDLDAYFSGLGRSNSPKVKAVSVDGAENRPKVDPNSDAQVEIDIEVVGAIAPGATIVVYFTPNTYSGIADAIKAASADKDNSPTVLSISWGGPESAYTLATLQEIDNACKAASDQGITVLAGAGDGGVTANQTDKHRHVEFPAADPWVLAVGGTEVTAVGDKIDSEVVWNQGEKGGASGGGVSEQFALPEWQNTANVPIRADGSRGRGIPDVVANASPLSGYEMILNGQKTVVGGTSASTPFWAGLVALINQGVGKNVEHLNQLLYKIGDSAGAFRRITKGDNTFGGVQGYSAGPNWSAVAGWGSPDGEKLLEAIKTQL